MQIKSQNRLRFGSNNSLRFGSSEGVQIVVVAIHVDDNDDDDDGGSVGPPK